MPQNRTDPTDSSSLSTTTLSATTATKILSRNDKRMALLVQLYSGASASIFYGFDNTVTNTTGIEIEPGEEVIWDGEGRHFGDLWVYSVAGEDVHYQETVYQ